MTVTRDQIIAVIERYCDLLADGTAAEIADLYADDAVQEDPIGSGVRKGREAILGFYANIEPFERAGELLTVRVAGNEAAFQFALTVKAGESGTVISPIDVMTFDDDAKITSMRAFWSSEDVRPL